MDFEYMTSSWITMNDLHTFRDQEMDQAVVEKDGSNSLEESGVSKSRK